MGSGQSAAHHRLPFTFIELRLNARGEGEGKLNLATRIDVSRTGRVVQLENFDAQPIHLNEVRRGTSR